MSKQKPLRVILFYILYCIVNEGVSFYLQMLRSPYFITLLNLFTIVEYTFFCYFIYLILPKSWIKMVVQILWIGFILFAFIDYFFFSKTRDFDSIASGIEAIIVLLLCMAYLFSQIRGNNNLLVYSTFNFWAVIAFFIYFSGTFFLYLMADKMMYNISFQKMYFIINISFNIFKNLLLCVAMTMKLNGIASEQKKIIPDLDDDLFIYQKN
ncbi:MAG TPA: hypothetical protein VFU62_02835 [Hanamia sp.]|nr:hypothetical protein [Hanamia sp.]